MRPTRAPSETAWRVFGSKGQRGSRGAFSRAAPELFEASRAGRAVVVVVEGPKPGLAQRHPRASSPHSMVIFLPIRGDDGNR